MIHQPLGGSQGEATEMETVARLILHTKDVLNTYLSDFCDQPIEKIKTDTDRYREHIKIYTPVTFSFTKRSHRRRLLCFTEIFT
jgi:hypothetical protein